MHLDENASLVLRKDKKILRKYKELILLSIPAAYLHIPHSNVVYIYTTVECSILIGQKDFYSFSQTTDWTVVPDARFILMELSFL